MKVHFGAALLLAGISVHPSAFAELTFKGFASVGGGVYSEADSTHRGADDSFSANPFTKFALQAKANVNDRVDFTAQFITRGTKDYEVEAEWVYATYKVADSTDVRVGRLRSPFFLYSDFLDVGYAYPWIAPPSNVYRFVFNTVEGVDVVNKHALGDWDTNFQAYYGRLNDETAFGSETSQIDLKDFAGINYSLSNDWLTLRFSYNLADYSIGTPSSAEALLTGLTSAGFTSVVDALEMTDEEGRFYGVGINIDLNDWLFTSEYTVLNAGEQSLISDDYAWYAMLGRRIEDVTFHMTYVERREEQDLSFLNAIPAGVDPNLDALIGGTLAAVGPEDEETNIILGLRYDFSPSAALKIEFDRQKDKVSGKSGDLVAVSIDMVF